MTIRVRRREREQTPKRGGHTLLLVQYLLLTFGLGALGYYGYVAADTYLYQDYENWVLDRELRGQPSSRWTYVQSLAKGERFVAEEEPKQVPPWVEPEDGATSDEPVEIAAAPAAKGQGRRKAVEPESDAGVPVPKQKLREAVHESGLVGRIVMPRLKVSAIIREGTDNRTLRRAVGHVKGTALPGEIGNVGLAGHRDSFFRGLRGVKSGDQLDIVTVAGTFHYVVDSTKIVTPKTVEVLAASAEPVVTLVTCYPFNYVGSAPKRFIVRAVMVDGPKSAPAQKGS